MAGRADERGRRDNAAETIEQTFIKLQAGSVAEQKRDSRDSGGAPPGAGPRGRRKGGTTRLELADVFGSEAAEQGGIGVPSVESGSQRSQPLSKTSARTNSRERRRGSTTRLDWADVLGSNDAALQIRRQASSVQPDNHGAESTGDRRQSLQTADPAAAVQSNLGRGFKAQSEPIAGDEQASGEGSGREFDGAAAPAADASPRSAGRIVRDPKRTGSGAGRRTSHAYPG
jgi:hypothetical protein